MRHTILSYLDQLRIVRGADALRTMFQRLAVLDREKTIQYLNDPRLQFPTLFLLMPEIEKQNLYQELTPRNTAAIHACARKAKNHALSERLSQLLSKDGQTAHTALKWMFETGMYWEGPSALYDAYDAAIDAAAGKLIGTYHDTAILPAVSRLIFRRNRKELYIHDLVWCFFQSCDLEAIKLTAQYLLSDNPKDVELSCRLLHLAFPDDASSKAARQRLYRQYMSWLNRHRPYLCFTGECFQQTSSPNPLFVNSEAQYLGRQVSPRSGLSAAALTPEEQACLVRFRSIPESERLMLASYSAEIHARDTQAWTEWMRRNISEQVFAAKSNLRVI